MRRYLYSNLIKWKNADYRKPLILQGARQVGKTYIVNQFAQNEYKNYLYLNFEKDNGLHKIFDYDLDPKRILIEIGLYFGKKISPHDTLLFFDEIQAHQRAITSLKYFFEEANEYHIIAAGSLLGVAIGKTISFPVGKVNFINMNPMDYTEFLWALDEEILADYLQSKRDTKPLSEPIQQKLTDYFKLYLFLGGMPEVVKNYINNKDIRKARKIQFEILKAYERDFSKYTGKAQALKNNEIWQSIPAQLAKENKKFKYSDVKKGSRASQYELSIEWLRQTGLVIIASNLTSARLPLSGHTDYSKFKLYLLDTGLLGAMLNITSDIIINPVQLFKEYNGAFIENFVATELKDILQNKHYYWTSRGEAEVDFVFEKKGEIYPLEVKSGTSRNLKSLRSYESKYNPKLIIRTSPRNYYQQKNFINIPLYAIKTIKNLID